jgi:nitroimidazol reductase NimA-like FMN-containing flavoprotein (pyridoxamine 5'-phosphate oxidase superfamily)
MIEVEELPENEIVELLARVGYGHLACCRGDRPYVVPVHYAYDDGMIFIYTTEGKKFEIIKENPNVCLQVEAVVDNQHWTSVIVDGVAVQIKHGAEHDRALELIAARNPTLTPAVSVRWIDDWVRENIEVVYRVTPTATSGRRSINRFGDTPFAPPGEGAEDQII